MNSRLFRMSSSPDENNRIMEFPGGGIEIFITERGGSLFELRL